MTARMEVGRLPDACALIQGFRDGTADPVQVMRDHLATIARLDPVLNAFSARASDAMDCAEDARARWANDTPKGPLDGLPIIIKDNLVSAGLPAAWGNAELASRTPTLDELPVAALRAAGAIVVGKGNTPEFAVEGYTGNTTFGTTRNPFDPALTPGGSSGGVVAAVACGMAVAGLGTDGGGSIRRPAGYTGLWGLKPGIGTVQRGKGLPQVLLDFETVGPITRSARDLALFQSVLAPIPDVTDRPLRILAVSRIKDAPCDPGILSSFASTVARLRALGHSVVKQPLPLDLEPLGEVWTGMAEIGLAHLARIDPVVMKTAADKYQAMAARGAARSAVDLYEALSRVFTLREAVRGLWGFDAVLMPTAAAPPWSATQAYPDTIGGQPVGPRGHAVYTGWVNAAGLPALAFPGEPMNGLPIGMQLIGDHGAEAMLLQMARALDR
ncbi:aspartyl-tRNA(Asn)/glutamyl-tRNA(Gln) amidotransferase subunit A [Sagittula marina]|uniref:Aspartyl-tRNA(Asn)/glutamyl-tRNA(Gln) amidotransferase subunit A n=1 Tax=Sagittula marina TaxID=943940 RepID=A0A7W6DS26_9RHOB|nr:amidase [Sagittula marina]MBB3985857.1 aspartyl-tRNA(Asn)/glutamyl-tRNA(Gln) amidotransferase subunit A [Sagittula marina]